MAATGEYNLGDECIVAEEIDQLFRIFPKLEQIYLFTYHKDSSQLLNKNHEKRIKYIPYVPYMIFRHPFRNISYFLQNLVAIIRSDLIIIGGGGIFFDTYGTRPFQKLIFLWSIRLTLARWLKKYIFFWAISLEISEEKHIRLLRHLFGNNGNTISVRDIESQKKIFEIGHSVHLIEDPVIGTSMITRGSNDKKRKVGLALRGGYLQDEWENLKNIVAFLRSRDLEPVFITHSFHSKNVKENDFLYYQEFAKTYNLEISKSLTESIKMYKEISYMVTLRLHGAILSASMGIPFLAITYGQKTRTFPKSIEYPYTIEGKYFSDSPWKEYIDILIKTEQELSIELIKKTRLIRENNQRKLRSIWLGL